MSDCDRICERAAGIAALPPGDPERDEAWAHARGCATCARALEDAARLQALLTPQVPPLARVPADARRAIASELRREARSRLVAAVIAAVAAFAACVALARHRSHSRADWALALALASAAAALGAASRRRPAAVVWLALIAVVGAAMLTGAPGPLEPALGVDCVATELVCGLALALATWLVLRRGTTVLGARPAAAGAAAGALAGAAALQLTCPAHAALPHLLAFHLGGVLVAALAVGLASSMGRAARAA